MSYPLVEVCCADSSIDDATTSVLFVAEKINEHGAASTPLASFNCCRHEHVQLPLAQQNTESGARSNTKQVGVAGHG